jgi:hypothetical protein
MIWKHELAKNQTGTFKICILTNNDETRLKEKENCTWMTPMFEDFSAEFGSSIRPCVCA